MFHSRRFGPMSLREPRDSLPELIMCHVGRHKRITSFPTGPAFPGCCKPILLAIPVVSHRLSSEKSLQGPTSGFAGHAWPLLLGCHPDLADTDTTAFSTRWSIARSER